MVFRDIERELYYGRAGGLAVSIQNGEFRIQDVFLVCAGSSRRLDDEMF